MADGTMREVLGRLERIESGFARLQKGYEKLVERRGADALWEKVLRLGFPVLAGMLMAAGAMIFQHENSISVIEKTRFTRDDAHSLERKLSESTFALPQIREDLREIKSEIKSILKEQSGRLRALESKAK